MARRRRFSEEPFGPTIETLMGEAGVTYRELAARTGLSAGYLNHLVHGNRPVPSNDVVRTLADAPGVERSREPAYRRLTLHERLGADRPGRTAELADEPLEVGAPEGVDCGHVSSLRVEP